MGKKPSEELSQVEVEQIERFHGSGECVARKNWFFKVDTVGFPADVLQGKGAKLLELGNSRCEIRKIRNGNFGEREGRQRGGKVGQCHCSR